MIYTVIDIETTGLLPEHGEPFENRDIIEFSYARFNESNELLNKGTLYFYYEGMSWSEEAYAVHHIPLNFLKEHASEFIDNVRTMYTVCCQSNLVGFNSNYFDITFIRKWLAKFNFKLDEPIQLYDMMLLYRKLMPGRHGHGPSLLKVCEYLGYTDDIIKMMEENYFGKNTRKHDSNYDVTATAMAFFAAKRDGHIKAMTQHSNSSNSQLVPPETADMTAAMFGTPIRLDDNGQIRITNINGSLPFIINDSDVRTPVINEHLLNRAMCDALVACLNNKDYTYTKGNDGIYRYELFPGVICELMLSPQGNKIVTKE